MIGKRSSCQDQVGSIANDDAAEVPEALEMRRDANSLAHLVRAVRGPCEPGSFESLAFGGCRTDFSESAAAVPLASAQAMHLEGTANGDARGREIAAFTAVGAEIHTCIRRVGPTMPVWIRAVTNRKKVMGG